jgi:hypothetical protein
MGELVVYSLKVNKEQLERAKRFLSRRGELLQNGLRDFIDVAADCERCLELHEDDAPISELQSAFTTLLAKCKEAWYLTSLLQAAVISIARISKVPIDFINNVLGEAARIKPMVHPPPPKC